jgi:hypothetical protein
MDCREPTFRLNTLYKSLLGWAYLHTNWSFGGLPPGFAIEARWRDYGRTLHISE